MNNIKVFQFSHFSPRKSERYNTAHSGIYIVEDGGLEVFQPDGTKTTLMEGDFILYNSADINNAHSTPGITGFRAKALVMPSDVFSEIKETTPVLSKDSSSNRVTVFTDSTHPEISNLKNTLISLIDSDSSPYAQQHIARALVALMVEAEPQLIDVVSAASNMTASQRIIRYIETNIDRDISLETLSDYMSMSIATLKRRLAAEGMTFSQILKVKRVNHAATQLRISQKSVTEIAFESGFKSAAHFSTAFKSVYQVSPKDFRNQVRD